MQVHVPYMEHLSYRDASFFWSHIANSEIPCGPAMRPVGVCDCHRPCKEWSAREPLGLASGVGNGLALWTVES